MLHTIDKNVKGDTRSRGSGETPTYSFVIPVHNESDGLHELFSELDTIRRLLDGPSELVMVDDGSTDDSWNILCAQRELDDTCSLVRLSRNFGHQVAVTAGLDQAVGEAVVIMDADLQDPPRVVLEMAERWRQGYQVVYGLRVDRQSDSWFKRTTADGFYRLMNRMSSVDIPAQVGDFRLVDRVVVDEITSMHERNRYVRGMFAWLGFRQIGVEYTRPERFAGSSSYGIKQMVRLAGDAVIGYSKAPVRIVGATGAALSALGALGVGGGVVLGLVRSPNAGLVNASRDARRAGLAGVQLVALAIIGEYVARIFDETTGRPLYVTSDVRTNSYRNANAADSERQADVINGNWPSATPEHSRPMQAHR